MSFKNMLFGSILASATMLGTVSMASASIIPVEADGSFRGQISNSYTYFEFTAPSLGADVFATITSSFKGLTLTAFNLFGSDPANSNAVGTLYAEGSFSKTGPFTNGSITASLVGGDNYFVGVKGSGAGTYTGTVALSAVPLPGTLALFGTALFAVGVAGTMKRSKKVLVA